MSSDPLPIAEARRVATEHAGSRLGTETVTIAAALDRVLAADVIAATEVPRFPSSAMDGFAVRDLSSGAVLAVVGEARAGHPYEGGLERDQAIRISTGAIVPAAAEAVVRQEDVTASDGRIETHVASRPNANVRAPGEDMHAGHVILTAGIRLGATELGAAVAAGAGELTVARPPAVTILCTGDELRAPGEPLSAGQIHNSNALMLHALVTHAGGAVIGPVALLPDDLEATEAALADALQRSDVVMLSGGVSVGPHDHVKPALRALGVTEHFWGVAMKPGKPVWFGSLGRKLVFGLPGNPVSVAVTFSLFARPAVDALLGALPQHAPIAEARLGVAVNRDPARDQAIRVSLEMRDGVPVVLPAGAQDSHLFSSLLRADCLAIVERGEGQLEPGETVPLAPLPL